MNAGDVRLFVRRTYAPATVSPLATAPVKIAVVVVYPSVWTPMLVTTALVGNSCQLDAAEFENAVGIARRGTGKFTIPQKPVVECAAIIPNPAYTAAPVGEVNW